MPTVLESLLDPISRIDFREQYYGNRPLLIRGHPKKFADLFTWDDLNRLLNASSYPHPQVEVASLSDHHPPENSRSLIEQCRAGATLRVRQIQLFDRKIGELARALEAETGEPMVVNLYLSQPAQLGFRRHYDARDVFVMQISGYKAWSVYETTLDKPVFYMSERSYDAPNEPILQCELAPGDLLYIPRGYWHEALAQRGLSLHLSFGVGARTGIDFLTWLVNELRSDARFRHELPLSFADEGMEVREERLREHVARLGEMLVSRLGDGETIRSFSKHCVLSESDFPRLKLPAQLLAHPTSQLDVRHFSRPARQRFVLEDGPAEDNIALNVWGHIFHFPKNARPLIEFVMAETAFAYEDALRHAAELPEQRVREVLDSLLREGILDAAGDASSGQ